MKTKTSSSIISVLIALASMSFLGMNLASANGAPIKVVLTHQQGISNWGPTSATGVAEIVMKEGEVSLNAVGLPALAEESYAGWLVNTSNNETLALGRFNADQSEVVKARLTTASEIPERGWNLLLVTVEAKTGNLTAPGQRKSIAGYFPDAAQASRTPAQLPRTGGDTGSSGASAPAAGQPAPAQGGGSNRLDPMSNPITYAVVVLAAIALGFISRGRLGRR